jgi:hypothetical protein
VSQSVPYRFILAAIKEFTLFVCYIMLLAELLGCSNQCSSVPSVEFVKVCSKEVGILLKVNS